LIYLLAVAVAVSCIRYLLFIVISVKPLAALAVAHWLILAQLLALIGCLLLSTVGVVGCVLAVSVLCCFAAVGCVGVIGCY
jgi:hypothetical protein